MIFKFDFHLVNYLISTILTFISPPLEVEHVLDHLILYRLVFAIGDSLEIFPLNASASAEPTI